MMRILIFVTLLAFCRCQGKSGDLNSVIQKKFGEPNSQTTANPLPQASTLVPEISDSEVGDKSCKMKDGRIGECVKYYLCNSVITEGVGIIDLSVRDGLCASYLDTCCPPPDSKDITNLITPPPTTQPQGQGFGWRNTEGVVIGDLATSRRTTSDKDGKSKFVGDKSCKMKDGRIGECVKYYLCNSVITEGVGIIDLSVRDGLCASYLDTCCPPPDSKDITNLISPPPTTQPQSQGCGWRNTEGVVNSDLATSRRATSDRDGKSKFGEFPWMVAVMKIEPVNDNEPNGRKLNVYVGGGSLIHPSIVLTAAHNVTGAKALRARAGEWNVHTTAEIYPHQDRDVAKKEVHKDFNKDKLFYDIALLFLAQPMDLTPNVGVVCLPPPRERVPGGTRCFASGWGKDKFGKEGKNQFILKKVEVPVVERSTCQTQLQNTSLGHSFELHTSFMCAGGEAGKGTCEGDGGSPLSCPIEYETGRYMQSGIVSWGIGCGEVDTPGVYVDVSHLRNWIDDQVAGAGYDPMTYTI